jgi:hypothetical protein
MKEEMPLALANMFQINRSEAMQLAVFQILDSCRYNDPKFGYVSVNDPHSLAAVLVVYLFLLSLFSLLLLINS